MMLWSEWWRWCAPLRAACGRERTFLWMCVLLVGFCVRDDLWGVTSFVRALGLQGLYYDRLLDFLHSPSLGVDKLARLWTALVVANHPRLTCVNGRIVVLGDGIKVAKAGRKMPGVKRLYQGGESNTKPQYILGHSCQAVSILAGDGTGAAAIPLAARIHEGVVFSNRDRRTLLDKMVLLLKMLAIDRPCYLVADAYYASRKIARSLLDMGQHLVTRARSNAVYGNVMYRLLKPIKSDVWKNIEDLRSHGKVSRLRFESEKKEWDWIGQDYRSEIVNFSKPEKLDKKLWGCPVSLRCVIVQPGAF